MGRLAKLEARIEEVMEMCMANRPVSGRGIAVNDVPGTAGRSISLFNQTFADIIEESLVQLQIYKIDDNTIGITPGAVGPTVEDGTDTWSVSGSGQIWAQVDVDTSNFVSNLSIFDNGSGDGPMPDDAHAFLVVGYYTTDGDGFLQTFPLVSGSQTLSICRSDPTTAVVYPTWALA